MATVLTDREINEIAFQALDEGVQDIVGIVLLPRTLEQMVRAGVGVQDRQQVRCLRTNRDGVAYNVLVVDGVNLRRKNIGLFGKEVLQHGGVMPS